MEEETREANKGEGRGGRRVRRRVVRTPGREGGDVAEVRRRQLRTFEEAAVGAEFVRSLDLMQQVRWLGDTFNVVEFKRRTTGGKGWVRRVARGVQLILSIRGDQ